MFYDSYKHGVSFLNNIKSSVFFCEARYEFLCIAYANFDTYCWHFVILNVMHSYLRILVAVRLIAGIVGSNPAEGVGVRLLCLLCVLCR